MIVDTACRACGHPHERRRAGVLVMLTHAERARLHAFAGRRGTNLAALTRSLLFAAEAADADAPAGP